MTKKRPKRLDKLYEKTNKMVMQAKGIKQDDPIYRMCLSKIGYDTEFEAEIMAAKHDLRAYRCNHCPHWHLTSQKS